MDLGYIINRVKTSLEKFKQNKSESSSKANAINNYWEGSPYKAFEQSYRDVDKVIQMVCNNYSSIISRLGGLESQIKREEERRRQEELRRMQEARREQERRRQEAIEAARGY